jgi:hypothetical protein
MAAAAGHEQEQAANGKQDNCFSHGPPPKKLIIL